MIRSRNLSAWDGLVEAFAIGYLINSAESEQCLSSEFSDTSIKVLIVRGREGSEKRQSFGERELALCLRRTHLSRTQYSSCLSDCS